MIKKWIEVTFQEEGIHFYPDCDLDGVEFLKYQHRHLFYFYVKIEVFHNDRDIEFILLKRELQDFMRSDIKKMNGKSCEMLAEDIINYLSLEYPSRDITVRVYEDNENGAILEYTKD